MRSQLYQISLIVLGIIATVLFSIFVWREVFPEYKIYQNDYLALENFRSSYTGEPIPPFSRGIKQIVFEREDKGPATIDRCVSCHVALEIPYFSPTKVAHDEQEKVIDDEFGIPVKIPNEDYIWGKLDQKINELTDAKVNEQLVQQGEFSKVNQRLAEANKLKELKTVHVDELTYDVTKVLSMHPLIGKETRPFEYHPIAEYGCTICHNGNGRGLTTDKAHGPVFDGTYEIEYMGPTPIFTEPDPENDPQFAKVFNYKPGPSLIFQTQPIFVGKLIEAKCMQCHVSSSTSLLDSLDRDYHVQKQVKIPESQKQIDALTKGFQQGQNLFITQACYACHRIAGLARGGIGPELTQEGKSYPWFIKESIVWPQADLKTSTMPNYKLDHQELEELMTFVLAQTGENRSISDSDYKTKIQKWEAGKLKSEWEKPITPIQMHDLNYGMTLFATQGCAACHRLKGFESNVGYRIEKEAKDKIGFDALYQEHQWFQKLFPEELSGSLLVKAIESHQKEIDEHIVENVRQHSLLEEIDKQIPENIESFYSNFRYASRAKDHEWGELGNNTKDPQKRIEFENKLKQWKERVHRVLMVYVQEYGLGRLIGPRPNWSGVYRSDEWLIEHFKKPTAHVARSIMPVFPFDETKFYALTYMLDTLSKRNRDSIREIWEHRGFNAQQAYHLYCSQCHGDYLQGDGPVSIWIYPIPKNLHNAEFLKNLTKARVIDSITHGVKGTPMPPWGEVAHDKSNDTIPILNQSEIHQLTNWLFQNLPGEGLYPTSKDVPKWQYTPEDVIKELHQEGVPLKAGQEAHPTEQALFQESIKKLFPKGDGLFADLNPRITISPNENEMKVPDLFDKKANEKNDPDKYSYYIKPQYFTEENIDAGKAFFELNCAVCHGTEADGSGIRAEYMEEAKPRMLTNLDWLQMRDDLRLLRSIKYGVPGTAMTPWGDLTSSLQRLQLVIFIRSLSEENVKREQLSVALYKTFSLPNHLIENARIAEYHVIANLQKELDKAEKIQLDLSNHVKNGEADSKEAIESYQKVLTLSANLQKQKKLDKTLLDLKEEVDKEQNIYKDLGLRLINSSLSQSSLVNFLQILEINSKRYQLNDNHLLLLDSSENESKIQEIGSKIAKNIEDKLKKLNIQLLIEEGKISSPQRSKEIALTTTEINMNNKLKIELISLLKHAAESRQKQQEIFREYQKYNR